MVPSTSRGRSGVRAAPDPLAPLTALRGVGPARAAKLERAGLRSVRDLLLLLPRRVVRWPERLPIAVSKTSTWPPDLLAQRLNRWQHCAEGSTQ